MENLQEIINKKAEKRATEDVQKLISSIKENHEINEFLKKIMVITDKNGIKEQTDMRSAFWSVSSSIPRKIIEHLTKEYIPEESRKFVQKVERLSEEIEELKEGSYD